MKNFKRSPTEHGRYAVLRSDFMMKKVFSHKELLLSFINAVIPDKNFVDLTFNPTQQLADKKEFGSSIYDVYCTTSTGEEIVVELQNIKQLHFTDRILFYSTYLIQVSQVTNYLIFRDLCCLRNFIPRTFLFLSDPSPKSSSSGRGLCRCYGISVHRLFRKSET